MTTNFEEAKEYLTAYLTQKKLSKTPARYKILEYIYSLNKPFNAEFLYEQLKNSYRLSLATIYNTLNILLDSNIIVKYHFDGELSLFYEKANSTAFHHIIVCSECGMMREFTDIRLRNTIHSRTFKGFKAICHTLTVYGLCTKCSKKSKKQLNK